MRRRIIICLALLLVLCVVGNAIALLCLNASIGQLSALAESHRIQVMRANLASSAVRIETDLMSYAANRPSDEVRRRDSVRRFRASLERCGACHHAPRVHDQLDQIQETFGSYEEAVDRLLVAQHTPEAPIRERDANLIADKLTRQTTEMADQAADHVSVRNTDAGTSIRNAWLTLCGTIAATLVVGGFIALHLQRRLTRPVDALLRGTKAIHKGHTDHRFAIDGDAEFRSLGDAFNEAYASLATAQESILQAEKMAAVGKLAAGIAHEVGNPLASISSVAQMMQRDAGDEKQAEHLRLIMQHINRVSEIVRELLTFSRPSSDDQFTRVDISSVLDNALSLLSYDKRVGQVCLDTRYKPGLFVERGNPDRLLLVFTNVMINAFDAIGASRNGDGYLTVTAHRDDDWIVIRFEDNGPGMSEEDIDRAFEPFFTTKAPGRGTGLGLWVCYQTIAKHNGRIHIESQLGQGTAVIIQLPQATPTPDVAAETPTEA